MKKDDSLSTSGLIVTIAFGVGISAALIAWGIVAWKGKQKQKREEQAALLRAASRHGKGRDVEAVASDANLPLITPGAQRSEQYNAGQGYSQGGQDYFNQAQSGGNSVTPPGQRGNAPQLHQGLGALGQETRY
jgi:type II secretory pathway pseudopilin PulG